MKCLYDGYLLSFRTGGGRLQWMDFLQMGTSPGEYGLSCRGQKAEGRQSQQGGTARGCESTRIGKQLDLGKNQKKLMTANT